MNGEILKNVCEYMNALSKKKYKTLEISILKKCILQDYKERKSLKINVNFRTKEGKQIIHERIVKMAKQIYNINFTSEDIKLYRKCVSEEYSNRTGKCAWGFAEIRKRIGYDPVTGIELK